jgi:hypothetical protein
MKRYIVPFCSSPKKQLISFHQLFNRLMSIKFSMGTASEIRCT